MMNDNEFGFNPDAPRPKLASESAMKGIAPLLNGIAEQFASGSVSFLLVNTGTWSIEILPQHMKREKEKAERHKCKLEARDAIERENCARDSLLLSLDEKS